MKFKVIEKATHQEIESCGLDQNGKIFIKRHYWEPDLSNYLAGEGRKMQPKEVVVWEELDPEKYAVCLFTGFYTEDNKEIYENMRLKFIVYTDNEEKNIIDDLKEIQGTVQQGCDGHWNIRGKSPVITIYDLFAGWANRTTFIGWDFGEEEKLKNKIENRRLNIAINHLHALSWRYPEIKESLTDIYTLLIKFKEELEMKFQVINIEALEKRISDLESKEPLMKNKINKIRQLDFTIDQLYKIAFSNPAIEESLHAVRDVLIELKKEELENDSTG